ncbi:DUF6009 family protein [Streptomyces chartreusis]|nr:DUF6009 family protein [Streptomyces chartreusis]
MPTCPAASATATSRPGWQGPCTGAQKYKEHDRSEQPNGMYRSSVPAEAVDPRTVAPGVWGEVTERAWGAPMSEA